MTLTKHQKLAQKMNQRDQELEEFYQKCTKKLNVLQLVFFESHLIIEGPLMSEKTLNVMIFTHRCAMKLLSPNAELRLAAKTAPFIGCIITPVFYPESKVVNIPSNADPGEKNIIPWGVKTFLPKDNIQKLAEAKEKNFLYCPDTTEMGDCVDWFDKEDRSTSLTNQILLVERKSKEINRFNKNIQQLAMPYYHEFIKEYFKLEKGKKIPKALLNGEFAPRDSTNIGIAYKLVIESLKEHKKRHFEDFQRVWRNRLESLMFTSIPWDKDMQDAYLKKYFFTKDLKIKQTLSRWNTNAALDRQTYSQFIRYFTNNFVQNPLQHQVDGEIALLLRIMIYVAIELKKIPIVKFLKLTSADFYDKYINIGGEEIELSCGLSDLIKTYIGKAPLSRKQKLFPNLTHKKLTYRLKKASKNILPSRPLEALPETFLSFPHPTQNLRISAKMRRHQMEKPPEILQNTIHFNKIKEQLVKKIKIISP